MIHVGDLCGSPTASDDRKQATPKREGWEEMVLVEGMSKTQVDNHNSVHVVCMQYCQLYHVDAHREQHAAVHSLPLTCHSRT